MAEAAVDVPVEKVPFSRQLGSFGYVYWLCNWMELVERFAYYGVRTVLPVFMVLAVEEGGPQLDHLQKGGIFASWAVVQSFIPIFSGGFADRYGYKVNIAISTVLKIVGYLLMGYCVHLAEWSGGASLPELRAKGADVAYEVFYAGAMFLALGTAIFKPGVQGLVANQMPKSAASLGWGLFYQAVNIGGFVGPLLAGYLRVLQWEYVFIACSVGISLNFIALLVFKEPDHHGDARTEGPLRLAKDALLGLLEPRMFFFTMSFCGFWLMFYQLFDILPNFIDDWVDSRAAASFLVSILGAERVPTVHGGNLTQEWIINVNALFISLLAFAFGYVTGLVRSLTAIVIGIAVSAVAIYELGMSMSGWWCLGAIVLFSVGEMSASPTKMRYLASIAPKGCEGQYMGYTNFTVGIGWAIGSIVAGHLYQEGGDKVVLAMRYLQEKAGVAAETLAALPKSEVLPFFEKTVGVDAWGTRELLWKTYEPYSMWLVFTVIGVVSMLGLVAYDVAVRRAEKDPAHPFNHGARLYVRGFLAPAVALLVWGTWAEPSASMVLLTALFGMMLAGSFARRNVPAP